MLDGETLGASQLKIRKNMFAFLEMKGEENEKRSSVRSKSMRNWETK